MGLARDKEPDPLVVGNLREEMVSSGWKIAANYGTSIVLGETAIISFWREGHNYRFDLALSLKDVRRLNRNPDMMHFFVMKVLHDIPLDFHNHLRGSGDHGG